MFLSINILLIKKKLNANHFFSDLTTHFLLTVYLRGNSPHISYSTITLFKQWRKSSVREFM